MELNRIIKSSAARDTDVKALKGECSQTASALSEHPPSPGVALHFLSVQTLLCCKERSELVFLSSNGHAQCLCTTMFALQCRHEISEAPLWVFQVVSQYHSQASGFLSIHGAEILPFQNVTPAKFFFSLAANSFVPQQTIVTAEVKILFPAFRFIHALFTPIFFILLLHPFFFPSFSISSNNS